MEEVGEIPIFPAFFQLLVEKNPDGIAVIQESGEIKYANPAFEKILRVSFQQGLKKNFFDFLEGKDRIDFQERFAKFFNGEELEFYGIFKIPFSNITTIWVEIRASLLKGLDNSKMAICNFRDVTYRIKAEEIVRKSQEFFRETHIQFETRILDFPTIQNVIAQEERLRALGIMVGGIIHDFNNTLAPILGISDLILNNPDMLKDEAKVLQNIRMVHTAAKDAAEMIARLKDFYRQRKTKSFAPLKIADVILDAISFTKPRWENEAQKEGAHFEFGLELQPTSFVFGNDSELREVFVNLILNAIDAMPNGGKIEISSKEENGFVLIEIRDNGIGMSEDALKHCFEPFFTTKGEKGSGLGLAIAKGILRQHDGKISASNRPEGGAVFKISLPVFKKNEEKSHKLDPKALFKLGKLRVLLVDDNPLVREVISSYLNLDNHFVETAENGLEGYKKFSPGKFDLVITDLGMPKMNGSTLASAIKKVSPTTPIVLLSGFGEYLNDAHEKPPGVDFVLAKPVTLESLRQGIQAVLRNGHPA
jgi:PAS domain S-box-containing protein